MKIPSKIDLIMWLAIGASVLGLLFVVNKWRLDSATLKVERREHAAEITKLNDTLAAERENTRKANEASTKYQGDLAALRAARADDPLPAVVCKRARLPEARTATGPDAARPADDPTEDVGDRDIGPQLDDFATACEANLIQLTRLQEWVMGR